MIMRQFCIFKKVKMKYNMLFILNESLFETRM